MNSHAVLVTGAAGGIGGVIAKRFLEEGWRVLGWDTQLGTDKGIEWTRVDVRDWDAVDAAAVDLPDLGGAVTCAGVGVRDSALETSKDDWHRTIDINLSGTFHTARSTHDALARASGTLITIASVAGTTVFRNRAPYCASKAAVLMLTRCLAVEWAADGIRCVAVSPGFTRTPHVQRGIDEGKTDLDQVLAHTPHNRLVEPAEIASVIWSLISDKGFAAVAASNVLIDAGFDALSGF
jgi:NAD(P)-dependent dehydrogenase (short-subunit alcohol dehydrogenase family)